MKYYLQLFFNNLLIIMAIFVGTASATCVRVAPAIDAGCDLCGVNPGLPAINLSSTYMQPVGTILASSIFDFTKGVRYGDGNKVLYQCDLADAGSIYEQIVTNGDDRVGGYYDLGAIDGNPGYFATYFPYVGIKLTHVRTGTVFTRYYQNVPLTSYETVGDKINIRVKDLSPIRADLIRLSSLPGYGSTSNFCGSQAASTGTSAYVCAQPNGYVIFVGPGIPGDVEGDDSALRYDTWGTGRWNAIGMGTAPQSTISYSGTCVVRNVTPVVLFPTISDVSLNAGETVQGDVSLTVECDNDVVQKTFSSVVVGLQTSYPAFVAANTLGLVNSSGGVEYLLSDEYDTNSSVAKGVGISLSYGSTGTAMTFIGWNNCTSSGCPAGITAGWYPLQYVYQSSDASKTGYTSFTTQFTAKLGKLPGVDVVPGKVKSTAYVLVRIQ